MANLKGENVSYSSGGVDMQGYLVHDSDQDGHRPGVLVVHEWWGCNEYARRRADMLAQAGYTAMAIDLYGGGQVAANPDEAGALMNAVLADLVKGRERFLAALEALKAHATVDENKIGAIGYCFGGGMVLHMARSGAPIDVVASFHGALAFFDAPGPDQVDTRIAVYNGEADSFIPAEDIAAFHRGMEAIGANYQFIQLPGQLHGFSNPQATANGQKYGLPLAYSELADQASWAHMRMLFDDVFSD